MHREGSPHTFYTLVFMRNTSLVWPNWLRLGKRAYINCTNMKLLTSQEYHLTNLKLNLNFYDIWIQLIPISLWCNFQNFVFQVTLESTSIFFWLFYTPYWLDSITHWPYLCLKWTLIGMMKNYSKKQGRLSLHKFNILLIMNIYQVF